MGLFDSILIVGDRGMLASAIKRELTARGIRTATGVDVHNCDITDLPQIEMWFEDVEPTLVINCAAFTNVDACESKFELANAVNGKGAGNLAEVCAANGAKLVHFSTDYVFDGTLRRPLKPDDPVGPQSAYGKSKLLGEQEIARRAKSNDVWLIIRTAWLYGPNGPNFPQAMLNAARAVKPLRVVSDQVGAPTFTHDLAAATMQLLDRNASGIWHIANSGVTNWFEFAKAIFQEFDTPAFVEAITSDQWKQIKPDSAIRPAYSVFDLSPFEKLTGKPLPDWRDALHRYRLTLDGAPT